jgi:hypothetical protein
LPYEKGNIEGGPFCFHWVSIIFEVNIQVWSSIAGSIVQSYIIHSKSDKTIDIMSFEIDTSHIHYEPLVTQNCNEGCTFHCNQVAVNVDMVDVGNCHSIT